MRDCDCDRGIAKRRAEQGRAGRQGRQGEHDRQTDRQTDARRAVRLRTRLAAGRATALERAGGAASATAKDCGPGGGMADALPLIKVSDGRGGYSPVLGEEGGQGARRRSSGSEGAYIQSRGWELWTCNARKGGILCGNERLADARHCL